MIILLKEFIKLKCNYGHDNKKKKKKQKKSEKCEIKYKYCECYLEYTNVKDNLLIFNVYVVKEIYINIRNIYVYIYNYIKYNMRYI